MTKLSTLVLGAFIALISCSKPNPDVKEEIRVVADSTAEADTTNSLSGDVSLAQLATYPNKVILTGLKDQRLITIYRKVPYVKETVIETYSGRSYYHEYNSDYEQFFMPGIDLQFGYNLINIAHYNFVTEKMKLLFDHPVLVRSIYYPSFEQDSIDNKPVNRNYFLISVYNEDTNKDTLINKSDLRKFIHVNADASTMLPLLPSDYSVERSQYDAGRDAMYLFARQDTNKNGKTESKEPLHVFWISLAEPKLAKRVY